MPVQNTKRERWDGEIFDHTGFTGRIRLTGAARVTSMKKISVIPVS